MARGEQLGDWGREVAATYARGWLLFIVTGILWLLLGFMLLSYRVASISITVIFIAIVFGMGAVSLFVISDVTSGAWRVLAIIGAIAAIGAAIGALVWPAPTILVVSLFVAWYLLIRGIVAVVIALSNIQLRGWWLTLLAGIISIALGAWAIGNPDRSVLLLVTILGVYAIFHGVTDLIVGVQLHAARRELPRS
jgi:uncharacterized membrane protein HdeD (DUF308 family)